MSPLAPNAPRSTTDKLARSMYLRLGFISVLLASAAAMLLSSAKPEHPAVLAPVVVLLGFNVLLAVGHAWWMRREPRLAAFVYSQVVGDLVTALGLVLLTGPTDTVFSLLFFVVILYSANLGGRREALIAASLSSLTLVGALVLWMSKTSWMSGWFPESSGAHTGDRAFQVFIQVSAFFVVAYLAGYLAQLLGQADDELKRRDIDLRALRALNASIVRSIPSGLITVDTDGHIVFFNRAAVEITGIDETSAIGAPLAAVLPPLATQLDRSVVVAPWERPEVAITHEDGHEVYIGMSISSLTNDGGEQIGWVIIFRDLTDVRKLEQAAKRQEHLAGIGELSAAIAHEIRNPLTAISGSVETLELLVDADGDTRELFEIILHEVSRLNGLITEFLDFARPVQSTMQTLLFDNVVSPTLAAFSERSDDVAVVDETQGVTAFVNVDPRRVQQVLWNLLNNAAEAMGGEGTIWVRAREVEEGRQRWLELSVEDDGPGLSPAVCDRIFDPFFTTKEHGTGLGLATSHRIVDDHGGLMRADNGPHGGARFTVLLPIYLAHASMSGSHTSARPRPS